MALTNAAVNARLLMVLGVQQKQTPVTGWCANVELTPAIFLPAKTTSGGGFTFATPLQNLAGAAQFDLFVQFAFDDVSQTAGFGLSNMAGYKTPTIPGAHGISRIYRSPFGSTTNGDELATTGSGRSTNYGLVVGWLQ